MKDLNTAIDWLKTQAANGGYKDIGLVITLHAGRVSKIQRVITEKISGAAND